LIWINNRRSARDDDRGGPRFGTTVALLSRRLDGQEQVLAFTGSSRTLFNNLAVAWRP